MGLGDRVWGALTTVILMNDKVERISAKMDAQQARIENLTERVIRLETALELAMRAREAPARKPARKLPKGEAP